MKTAPFDSRAGRIIGALTANREGARRNRPSLGARAERRRAERAARKQRTTGRP